MGLLKVVLDDGILESFSIFFLKALDKEVLKVA